MIENSDGQNSWRDDVKVNMASISDTNIAIRKNAFSRIIRIAYLR